MKQILLVILLHLSCNLLCSQTTDSIDNLILKIPSTWQVNKQAGFTEVKYFDKDKKNFCQLAVYAASARTADMKNDFTKEWKELVEQNFTVFTLAEPIVIKSRSGHIIQRMGAKAVGKDGKKYYVQLNVYDFGPTNQSVIAISGTQKQLQVYDSLWQSLITTVKMGNNKAMQTTTFTASPPADKSLVGKWAKSSSGLQQYQNGALVNLLNSGTHKGQYHFKEDGTYSFYAESMFSTNEYNLIDETGTYTLSAGKLTLSPSKSNLKKLDAKGVIKKQESLSLAKRVYNWQMHYFEGIRENNLVLSGVAENVLDGGFASNDAFPNSFLYSKEFKPEWRFKTQ